MNRFMWEQHKKQLLVLVVILLMHAAVAIPIGSSLWHIYQHAASTCGASNTCSQLTNTLFRNGWQHWLNPSSTPNGRSLVGALIQVVPFLLGIFVGVPLITQEYNAGTNLLVWTRSISRRKWLTVKLAWVLIAVTVFAGAFAALTTLWSRAGNALYADRFFATTFEAQGIVLIGYVVLAVSLGIALGAWLKRTMAAIGFTLAVLLIAQVAIANFIRPHYMTPVTSSVWTNTITPGVDPAQIPSGAWLTSYKIVDKKGQALDWSNPPKQCIVSQPPQGSGNGGKAVQGASTTGSYTGANGGPIVGGACLESLGYHYVLNYEPSDRYWDFQGIELGLYLALSLLPLGATYWLVLKRDA